MPTEIATIGGGCFWCTEAVFKRLKGVESVESGYSGGNPPAHSGLSPSGSKTGGENPSYGQVSSGETGHAEAIQIKFEPQVISYQKLLDVFWKMHDPTTLNQQGADVGTQYRSIIFYHDETQKKIAEKSKKEAQKHSPSPIVTQIVPYANFYTAESYHQDYYEKNQNAPYCQIVIDPKIQKLYKEFGDMVKEES